MNGSRKIGLALAALLGASWQPAAAQDEIVHLMPSLMPAGSRCTTAINSPSTTCELRGLGPKGLAFQLQYASGWGNERGWGTADVHLNLSYDIDDLRPYLPSVGEYFVGLGLSRADVSRCLAEPFELSREFRFTRFLLGDATQTTLMRLGDRALICELNYWSGKFDIRKGKVKFPGVWFSARWMAYSQQGSDPREANPPRQSYGRRKGDGN
jgi:hypothetical protein